MLMRHDPFREIERMMSTMFDASRTPRSLPMDAYRRGDELFVHLDLPGVDPESIDLTVERNVLSVTARRVHDRSETEELYVSERPQGVFQRQVFLGEGLDADAAEVEYVHGVLTIRVPVLESAKPRRIPIAVGGEQAAISTGGAGHVEEAEQVAEQEHATA